MSVYTLPPSFYSPGRTAYAPPTDTKAKQQQAQQQGFMKKALIGTAVTAVVLGGGGVILGETRRELFAKGLKDFAQSAQQKLAPIIEHGVSAFQKAWDANATAPHAFSRLKQSFKAFPDVLKGLANPPKPPNPPKPSRKMFGFFG